MDQSKEFTPSDIIYFKGTDFLNSEIRKIMHKRELYALVDKHVSGLEVHHGLPTELCDKLSAALKAHYGFFHKAATSPSFVLTDFPAFCGIGGSFPITGGIPTAATQHMLFTLLTFDVLIDCCRSDEDIDRFRKPRPYSHNRKTLLNFIHGGHKPSYTSTSRFSTPDNSNVVMFIKDYERLKQEQTDTRSSDLQVYPASNLTGLVKMQEKQSLKAVKSMFVLGFN